MHTTEALYCVLYTILIFAVDMCIFNNLLDVLLRFDNTDKRTQYCVSLFNNRA